MAFIPLTPDNFEVFDLVTHPTRYFSSGSTGVTGSVLLYARPSSALKEVDQLSKFNASNFDDSKIDSLSVSMARATGSNLVGILSQYMAAVDAQPSSARLARSVPVRRVLPTSTLTSASIQKRQVVDVLLPYYRGVHPSAQFSYANYHSLNFFTSSNIPPTTFLAYANSASSNAGGTYSSGSYVLTGGFTIDFKINPRYTTDSPDAPFRAGTVLHLSSSYAVSLVTGSSRGIDGRPNGYRLLLQLSQSCGILPSSVDLSVANNSRAFPGDLTFLSDDNSLQLNTWHHAAIRWGTTSTNGGTGSFLIDRIERGRFIIPSASVAPPAWPAVQPTEPPCLMVGNFWVSATSAAANNQQTLFNAVSSVREGVDSLAAVIVDPSLVSASCPLAAEVHEIRIRDSFIDDDTLFSGSSVGLTSLSGSRFYLPPFFTRESSVKTALGLGGVPVTPFIFTGGRTDTPFNVALSFGVGAPYINLENFTRDLSTGKYPRMMSLSASKMSVTSEGKTGTDYLYSSGSVAARNLLLLPCDDGQFVPSFVLLRSGSTDLVAASGTNHDRYVADRRVLDLSMITLRNLTSTSSIVSAAINESGSISSGVMGPTPDNPTLGLGSVYSVLQRTRDSSSNQIVIFDVSNIFYGQRIRPGTVVLSDTSLTGSGGLVSIRLQDDGMGNLFRANSSGSWATWASVGNVLYDEGILLIKSPHLPLFGANGYSLSFQGQQALHVLRTSVTAGSGMVNSSSNPSFQSLSASLSANAPDDSGFVYITGINYHDEDLNVVARAALSQPVLKRSADRLVFRGRLDF